MLLNCNNSVTDKVSCHWHSILGLGLVCTECSGLVLELFKMSSDLQIASHEIYDSRFRFSRTIFTVKPLTKNAQIHHRHKSKLQALRL